MKDGLRHNFFQKQSQQKIGNRLDECREFDVDAYTEFNS